MTSLKNKSNDWAGAKSLAKQGRKRGRPSIQSTFDPTLPGDEDLQRKERVRLAQRAYRNRKDLKVDGLNARVARLEYALEQTIKSFKKFQDMAIEVDGLPPKFMLEISRTALDIASAAQKAHSGEPIQRLVQDNAVSEKSSDGQDATKNTAEEPVAREAQSSETAQMETSVPRNGFGLGKTTSRMGFSTAVSTQQDLARMPESHRSAWFAARLHRLCLEEGFRLLTSPTITYDDLHPALSIHLNWVTVNELCIQMMQAMANNFEYPPEDQVSSAALMYPEMYRSIEGNSGIAVPRMPKVEPQQLVYGRTRTKLSTNLHDFQGDWLEPIDVQEYLEGKGIFLGSSWLDHVVQIAIPETTLADIWTQDASTIFTEEIQRSRVMSTSWPFANESQGLEPVESVVQPAESQVPTLTRYDDSLAASNPGHSIVTQAPCEYPIQRSVAQYSQSNDFYPSGYTEKRSITLHLDRLLRLLVEAACCIGFGPGIRKEAVDHALRVSIAAY